MRRIILSSLGLMILAFVMYAMNMLMLPELIFLAALLFPIYAYTGRGWNVCILWSVSSFIGLALRYLFQYILIRNEVIVEKPIDLSNELVRQYSCYGLIIGMVLYAIVLFVFCSSTILQAYKNCKTIEEVRRNKHANSISNLYSVTIFIIICELLVFMPVYRMKGVWVNMMVFALVFTAFNVSFSMVMIDSRRRACDRIYKEMEKCGGE